MVQSNLDGRSRVRRTRQSEEQAPLVESYLSGNSSTIYHGTKYSSKSHSKKLSPNISNNHNATETRGSRSLSRAWDIIPSCHYADMPISTQAAQTERLTKAVIENGNACLLIVRQTMLPFFTLPAVLAWVTLLISVPECSVLDKPFLQYQCISQSSILKHLLMSGVFPLSYEKPFLHFGRRVS